MRRLDAARNGRRKVQHSNHRAVIASGTSSSSSGGAVGHDGKRYWAALTVIVAVAGARDIIQLLMRAGPANLPIVLSFTVYRPEFSRICMSHGTAVWLIRCLVEADDLLHSIRNRKPPC
jgi:hypothetical protein